MAAPTAAPVTDTPTPETQSDSRAPFPSWARLACVGLTLSFIAVHLFAVFRENVNWDELALLARSVESIQSGKLIGGGRPGLATLLLLPFADGCASSITAVVNARLFWSLFTFGYLGGIYALVAHFDAGKRWSRAGFLAVGLIALVPLFQRWSIQVRTDQPALAFATWGGVALLASRKRPWLGAVAGLLFTIGYLFSQKAAYVVALSGLLAAGAVWIERDVSLRREARRLLGGVVSGLAVYFGYLYFISLFFEPALQTTGQAIAGMNFYRQLGAMAYKSLPPLLIPHALLLISLSLATARYAVRPNLELRRCLLAWGVFGLGIAVGTFHASRFAYFWMTLGVFPAVALAIAWGPISSLITSRAARLLLGLVTVLSLARALPAGYEITRDTISIQHRSLDFIERNLPPDARGFHPEKALFCRNAPHPFEQTYFSAIIHNRFSGSEGSGNQQRFVEDFRARPVSFLVDSFRLSHFPNAIKHFWGNSYVRYAEGVLVAGRYLQGPPEQKVPFEVLVSGEYTLHLPPGHPPSRIAIGEDTLGVGGIVYLSAGQHLIELLDPVEMGLLTLRLDDPPQPRSLSPFYNPITVAELDGGRRWSYVPGL